ncbi:MAG: diguanylate cyclase, partial [Sulfurimonas sp.]|nr:diguanylate cyclase [Sulfurimonas sp.]
FINSYNDEIAKTKEKINGVSFAQEVQKFILKIQKLRGYSQFDENLMSEADYALVVSNVALIKADALKDVENSKNFKILYPTLYDKEYEYVKNEIETLINSSLEDKTLTYQKYTYVIEQLQEKMYYLGFKSKLLLESDSDKYFLIDIMLKHLPNLIEVVGKIRAKTSRAILENSTDDELRYSIKNNCLLCEDYSKQVQKTIEEIREHDEKARLLSLLENVNTETKKMQEYVKKTVLLSGKNINALEFFTLSTNVIDKIFVLYRADAEFLNQKLNQKLKELEEAKLHGIIIGAFVVIFILLIIASMVRSYTLYAQSEKKIKNNLTAIIKLKNDLEKCNTIEEIASQALYFFSEKFGVVQGAIYLFHEENNKLYLASSYATNEMKPIVELGEGLVGEVAIQKKSIATEFEISQKQLFRIENLTVIPSSICTLPLMSHEKIFGVLQLAFTTKHDIVHNEDFTYFIDMIIGFLRDAKSLYTSKKYIDLIDKYVITSKTNTKGVITDVSDAFTKISGYTKEEIIGKSHSIVAHQDTPKEVYENLWNTILDGKIYKGEFKNRNKNMNDYWIESTITPQMDKYGNIMGFSAIVLDITDKKRIEQYSITDALTGLYNRRFFDVQFEKDYKISKRDGKNLVLLMIDIDYFKQYNDFYGHQKGDEALKIVAKTIQSLFKRANDYAYRLGGEEFAVSFYAATQEEALERAELLRKAIQNEKIGHVSSPISDYLSLSIGLAFLPKACKMDVDGIYQATDKALYNAKNGGRNRVEVTPLNP